ncbi:hypothetical protein LJC56_04350 [Christensenellaceae bacterium OttesenSCG-928-K19]|nr:hypothetical protein [Christensenellaceae bacterium OttesenSCG-928-K19]
MENNIYCYIRDDMYESPIPLKSQFARNIGISKSNIFIDLQKGRKYICKKEYHNVIAKLKKGDLLILNSMRNLGRDYTEMKNEWRRITKDIGADIAIIGHFDTLDKAMLNTQVNPTYNYIDTMLTLIYRRECRHSRITYRILEQCMQDIPLLNTPINSSNFDGNILVELIDQLLIILARTERSQYRKELNQITSQYKKVKKPPVIKNGVGRPRITFPPDWVNVYCHAYKFEGISATEAMKQLGLKKNSFYKLAKLFDLAWHNPDFQQVSKNLPYSEKEDACLKYAMSLDYALVKEQEKQK